MMTNFYYQNQPLGKVEPNNQPLGKVEPNIQPQPLGKSTFFNFLQGIWFNLS
jgi:hypothetical protein